MKNSTQNNIQNQEQSTEQKLEALSFYLKELGSVTIAFSGGVDSTFLLKVAKEALGKQVLAVTAKSHAFPEAELKEAIAFCEQEGIRHVVIDSSELMKDAFLKNPPNRCYFCKRAFLEQVKRIAQENEMNAVVEGSNVDDEGDYRPGRVAVAELSVKSPLYECGLHKDEIRRLSKRMGLQIWNKPSCACLASRFPYGDPITEDKLQMVEQAEQLLKDMGFGQMRVRVHGLMARIEVLPDDFEKLMKDLNRKKITQAFREYGFQYVTVDLEGYRVGSMNEVLEK